MERCLLDGVGYLTMSLCVLVFMYDRYRIHSPTIYGSSAPLQQNPGINSEKNKPVYREQMLRMKFFESFIMRRKLVCESVLYFAVIVLTAASLLNIVERSFMVPFLLKFLLLWFISSYIFYFFYNIQRLQKHFVQDMAELHKILFRFSFWRWVIPRIISSDRFRFVNPATESNGMAEAVALQCTLLLFELCYYYPCYYFYFYNDSLNTTDTIFESIEFTRRRNIFVLNILMHWSISYLLISLCNIVGLGTPKWGRKAINKVINLDYEFALPYLRRLLQCNTCIYYARIAWHYFTGNSSTVTLLCIAIRNFIAYSSAEYSVIILEHKDMAGQYYKPRFVECFTRDQMKKNSKYCEGEKCADKSDQEIVDAVSILFSDVLEAMLDKTSTRYVMKLNISLHCIALHSLQPTILHHTVWQCTIFRCTTPFCSALHYIFLCSITPHHTARCLCVGESLFACLIISLCVYFVCSIACIFRFLDFIIHFIFAFSHSIFLPSSLSFYLAFFLSVFSFFHLAHVILCEAARPVPPILEPVQLPPTNIMGGPRFESEFVNLFEKIYLQYLPPIYEMESKVDRDYDTDDENENENVVEDEDSRGKDEDIIRTQLDSSLTSVEAARAHYQELIGMEL